MHSPVAVSPSLDVFQNNLSTPLLELRSSHDLDARRRYEAKLLVWYFDVLLLLKKAKIGNRAVEFLHHDAHDQAIRRD